MKRLDFRISHLNWQTAIISLIAAALTLGVTVVGLVIPRDDDIADQNGVIAKRDQQIDSLRQQLTSANARLESRQETIDSLTQENLELKAAVPYTVTADAEHKPRKADTISLAKDGDTIDLNSTLPHFRKASYVWDDTLSYDGESLILAYGTSSLTLPDGVASYKTCEESAAAWKEVTRLDPHDLATPATCLRLSSKRYAAIQVLGYNETTADITITVWD